MVRSVSALKLTNCEFVVHSEKLCKKGVYNTQRYTVATNQSETINRTKGSKVIGKTNVKL